tara:strand:+ start:938 stop:1114 length:177 start_codon:yes stop_codon:yes gene_type:complete
MKTKKGLLERAWGPDWEKISLKVWEKQRDIFIENNIDLLNNQIEESLKTTKILLDKQQ